MKLTAFPRLILLFVCALMWTVILAGCSGNSTDSEEWLQNFQLPDPADFSGQDRVTAFTQAHQKLSREYAFTQWKGICWNQLYQKYLPQVREGAAADDPQAYLVALRSYISELNDGHASLPRSVQNGALLDSVISLQSGGGYGLGLAELEDGTVIAAKIAPGSPAAAAGIIAGARILTWGQMPIGGAIDTLRSGELIASVFTATDVHKRLEKLRLLTRAPVGTQVEVGYLNPGASSVQQALLTATDDHLAGLSLLNFAPAPTPEDESAILYSKILPSGYGYIRLTAMADLNNLQEYPDFIRIRFLQILDGFNQAGVPGLVFDIRGNHGGFDSMAADLCGTFSNTPSFFEMTEFFDKRTNSFLRFTLNDRTGEIVNALMITAQTTRFLRPVVAIVNPLTISSGEGLARCVNELDRGGVVGFYGTRGSFGLAGGAITLPDNLAIHYPFGRSLNEQGIVQIDSRHGQGGVLPKFRIPRTFDNVMAYAGGQDVELQYAVEVLTQLATQP